MAHEKRKFRHSKVGRIDASYGESAEFARFLYRPKRGRDNHVFEIWWGRFELAGGELRFCLEPWWNPAVEMQAVMRAHRIGQTREVTAFRFACKDTIETKMHELQKLKRLVFEGTMDGNEASMAKLSPEDLQFLFKR